METSEKLYAPVVGIMGIGTYLPKTYMTAAEIALQTKIPEKVIAEKFGVIQKPVPQQWETTSYMGIEASRKALEMAAIQPEEIDVVVWNGAQHKDYPCWLASLKVAHELGAKKAWGYDMEAMCGSMMVGMETVKSLMLQNEEIRTVLLVSGYRNLDLISLAEPSTTFMLDIGAGGAAMVLKKGYDRNVILGSSFKGDGSFSEDCVVPYGGTKQWPPSQNLYQQMYFRVLAQGEDFKQRLGETTMPNFYGVIRESLRKSGYTQKDIDYLAILHFKRSAHLAVLEELGLNESQTTYLDEFGHIGQNDQVLSIELGVKDGKIKNGDIIVMVGAGLGFVWASSVVRWGSADHSQERRDQG